MTLYRINGLGFVRHELTPPEPFVPDEFIVTDHFGTIHGRRPTEAEALVLREELIGLGVECWIVGVADLEVEGERPLPAPIVGADPGDETDHLEAM